MIRSFIAIPIPATITPFLHAMGRSLPGARTVSQEQIHLTLRFIGEIEWNVFQDMKESLTEVDFTPFPLTIQGVGHFPPKGKPRVLWAGTNQKERLSQLRNSIDKQLKLCGIAPEGRKFSPHITFARLKTTSLQKVTEFLAGNSFLSFEPFDVTGFNLYSSKLTPKGAIHTVEGHYPQ